MSIGSVSSYNIEPVDAITKASDRKPHQQYSHRKQDETESFQQVLNEAMKENSLKTNRYYTKFLKDFTNK
jgi:hypothetical protein